ncbi:MAG: flagellar biosynthetic protein FliO [bacterium]
MQNQSTDPCLRTRRCRTAITALLLALVSAPAHAQQAAQQPRAARTTQGGAPVPNAPVDATAPVTAPADPTPTQIGTGGVVELTSLDPVEAPQRDSVVIPTELEPGAAIPPTKRAAPAGRPLGKPAAQDPATAATQSENARSLAAGAEGEGAFMGQVVPTALALAGTIALIFVTRSLLKRFGNRLGGGKRPSGVVEVLARYPFARGHHIVLIKVGRRVLVTHQSAQGIQTLSEFTSQADVADLIARCEAGSRGTDQFTFDSLLRNSDREFDAPSARERGVVQKPQRADTRSGLPASVRGAEIETIDLTRRRGAMR